MHYCITRVCVYDESRLKKRQIYHKLANIQTTSYIICGAMNLAAALLLSLLCEPKRDHQQEHESWLCHLDGLSSQFLASTTASSFVFKRADPGETSSLQVHTHGVEHTHVIKCTHTDASQDVAERNVEKMPVSRHWIGQHKVSIIKLNQTTTLTKQSCSN